MGLNTGCMGIQWETLSPQNRRGPRLPGPLTEGHAPGQTFPPTLPSAVNMGSSCHVCVCLLLCMCVCLLLCMCVDVCVFTVVHVCGCVCVVSVCVTVVHVCEYGCVWCCSSCVPCTNAHIMHENYLSLLCPDVCRLLSLAVDTTPCSVFYLYVFCACHYWSSNLNSRIFKLECHSLTLQLAQFISVEPDLCVLLPEFTE